MSCRKTNSIHIKMKGVNMRFAHMNFNVRDLETSLSFYNRALGLKEQSRIEKENFTICYLGDGVSDFQLELTWLKGHPQPYDLGECEFHLAFATDDFAAVHKKHADMGCICMENPDMGIYFIEDPDGYWLEIVPAR